MNKIKELIETSVWHETRCAPVAPEFSAGFREGDAHLAPDFGSSYVKQEAVEFEIRFAQKAWIDTVLLYDNTREQVTSRFRERFARSVSDQLYGDIIRQLHELKVDLWQRNYDSAESRVKNLLSELSDVVTK